MNLLRLVLYMLPVFFLCNTQGLLLSKCSSDSECKVVHSHCQYGLCVCQPFFAQYNFTCLPSRLLNEQCIIEEQCTMKVAQSTCSGGKCKCSNGFLQFRHHTCLSAAKPGDVCLNNEHCKLWNKNSHCHYLIPNLIGRCNCNDQTRLYGTLCMTEEDIANLNKEPTTESSMGSSSDNRKVTDDEGWNGGTDIDGGLTEKHNAESNEYDFEFKIPSKKGSSISDPFYEQKKHHIPRNSTITSGSGNGESSAVDKESVQIEIKNQDYLEKIPQEAQQNISTHNEVNYRESVETTTYASLGLLYGKGQANETSDTPYDQVRIKFWEKKNVVTLGLPCSYDKQCEAADIGSKCINNVCECAVKANETEKCLGCAPETFQCHSSGICLSWFFVCDGKIDCSDGSDEECNTLPCPKLSFQCGEEGICVSRSTLCDGTRNCPNGEDELFCERKEGNCPPNSFQCKSGQCLPEYEFCNAIPACSDGSDELEDLCGAQFSEEEPRKLEDDCPFRCNNGRCRSTAIMCSGRDGCGDNSDEQHCAVCRCPSKA